MRAKLSSPKIIALIGTIAIAIVAVVGWFGFVAPQQSRSSKLETQIGEVETQVQVARIAARTDHGDAKNATAKLHVLAVAMPKELRMPNVLRELIWNARLANIRLDSVKPGVATALSGYAAVPIDVTVTGHYFNVERFLKRLRLQANATGDRVRASGRLFDVATVSFQASTADLATITASLHVNVFVYSALAPAAAPVSAEPTDTSSSESASAAGEMP